MACVAAALLAATALAILVAAVTADTEANVLLKFRATLRGPDDVLPQPLRQWGTVPGPCNGKDSSWYGVTCHHIKGTVVGLQLEYLGLEGPVPDINALAALRGLRALSLANNKLMGLFPNVSDLAVLKMLYLSRNQLAGPIPDGTFGPMRGLRKLYLSENGFTGLIPRSITSPRLLVLELAKNQFEGPLPDFQQKDLQFVDVSYNNLSGPIPEGMRRFNASMFQGNKGLCGPPLNVTCPLPASPPPSSSDSSLKGLMIVAIVVIVLGALLAAAGIITAVLARRNEPRHVANQTLGGGQASGMVKLTPPQAVKVEQGDGGEQRAVATTKRAGQRDDLGRLVFIQEGRQRFDLEDLLRASAEVLGSGNFGASYKATLFDGPSMVVKRFKEMNGVGREDFREHMRRLGRLVHPNLLPLVAYLYKKEEKLIVTDYMVNGSLAHLLHGTRASSLPPLDWPKRLKIIKGVARGLAYLYDELPMLTVPHGHLKSSNVLLDASFEPYLSDYALVPVITPQHASQVMVAYKSPECAQQGRPSKKSDVWSLGILILEVLTGKFPANYLRQGRAGTDLAGWVHSVVREEWTGEVFDKDMRGAKNSEGEMVKLLKVGLGCCDSDMNKRWDLKETVARIEELKERDTGDDSSTASSLVSDGGEEASRAGEPLSHST